jgi:hypothetical protein
VTGYSLRYQATTQPSHSACSPEFSYPTGYDERAETVTLTLSGLKAGTIAGRGGGPMTRTDLFGGATSLERHVSKQLVSCTDGSQRESVCSDSQRISFGSQETYSTGSFKLSPNRSRKIVRVRMIGFGFEPEILECPSDPEPGVFVGPPVALNQPVVLRTTVPLKRFARSTTTIRIARTLEPPPDAAARGIPLGTAKIAVTIVLKRS